MTDVTIWMVAPVTDHSTTHTLGEDFPQPPLGGFSGDLESGYAVLWDPTDNHSQQAGKDVFEYALGTDDVPDGETLNSITLQINARYRTPTDAVGDAMGRTGQTLYDTIPGSGPPDYDPTIYVLDSGRGDGGVTTQDYTYVVESAFKSSVQARFWLDDSDLIAAVDVLAENVGATWYEVTDIDLGISAEEWLDGSHTVYLRCDQPDLGTIAPIAELTVYEARLVFSFGEGGGGGGALSTIDSERGGVVFIPMPPGDYEVSATTVNQQGTRSDATTPLSVTVS